MFVRSRISIPGFRGVWRTYLGVPLRQQGEFIGALNARRIEVRPFTPAQIKLLETFADQAVIAIENVRLFQELKESLEQQTATSEILGVIASSPTDIQPVLDTVAQTAAQVCDANDAIIRLIEDNVLRRVAHFGTIPASVAAEIPIDRNSSTAEPWSIGETIHVHDVLETQIEFPEASTEASLTGFEPCWHTVVACRCPDRGDPDSPHGRTSFHGQTNRAAQNFRRSGRHCHRERAIVQRNPGAQCGVARGAGASDGDLRGARHHQPLAHRRAAGARRHC